MTNHLDNSIEALMAENGRLQEDVAALQNKIQQLNQQIEQLQTGPDQHQETPGHVDVVQVVSDAIMVTDTQFCIQSWNRAAETMNG